MANAKKAPAVAVTATPDMIAAFTAFMAAQSAAVPTVAAKAKEQSAKVDPAVVVTAELEKAGGKLIRSGKSGSTDKSDKMWIDCKFGNLRIQGNAFVIRK